MNKLLSIAIVLLSICLLSCKGDGNTTSGLQDLDLMKYGMPIKIKAPADPVVEASDMGIMKDVTIKSGDQFYLQISSGVATTTDAAVVKSQQMLNVKGAPFFDEVLEQDDNGFIYRKKITEDRINHDFRFVKIQGDQEYIFQTGLMGQFSLEDVQAMYAAVK